MLYKYSTFAAPVYFSTITAQLQHISAQVQHIVRIIIITDKVTSRVWTSLKSKPKIVSEFSNKMMISGYSEQFRLEVIQSPVRGFEKQWERADKGITPLHRPCEFQAEQRWKKKHMNKTSWYNAVLFIQATPGGILQRMSRLWSMKKLLGLECLWRLWRREEQVPNNI